MLARVLKILVKRLVRGLGTFLLFDQILKHVDIIYYVFVLYERYVCRGERANLFHYFAELILVTKGIDILAVLLLFVRAGRNRVARVPIKEAVLEIFSLLESFVLRSGVDQLAQNAAEAPHVDFVVVYAVR